MMQEVNTGITQAAVFILLLALLGAVIKFFIWSWNWLI